MNWWHYLLLVNIYLLLFYGFYVLLLRRETFFQLNRMYLVAAALLSFFIPLIQSDWVKNLFITQKVQYTIYNSPVMFYQFKPIQNAPVTIGQIWLAVYLGGIAFLAARFAWQLAGLKRALARTQSKTAFSFFKKVRLGDQLTGRDVIAAHEQAHAQQWHSADILLVEAVMIINWFNPVVYFYRFAIKHIHEFIADRQALNSGTDKADYALLLLSQTFDAPAHGLVNPFFNHSLLKQRIVMLQKNKSSRAALIKYGFSAPLFMLMLILSSATIENNKTVRLINSKTEQVFFTPVSGTAEIPGQYNPLELSSLKKTNSQKTLKKYQAPIVDTVPKKDDKVFTAVEQEPGFPGGINAFFKFLATNIHYPADSREKGIQGRVIISFIVERDGSLTNVRIARGIADDIDKEAMRVIQASPRWNPGVQNGNLVRVSYTVPIEFSLDGKPLPRTKRFRDMIENKNHTDIANGSITDASAKSDTGKFIVEFNPSGKPRPLYIVDGKQVNSLDGLAAEDLQSVTVLKDKTAIAAYGSRAAYGVIVVKTKKEHIKP